MMTDKNAKTSLFPRRSRPVASPPQGGPISNDNNYYLMRICSGRVRSQAGQVLDMLFRIRDVPGYPCEYGIVKTFFCLVNKVPDLRQTKLLSVRTCLLRKFRQNKPI